MTNRGTIVDDCIFTKVKDDLFYVVINAGCKDKDMVHFAQLIDAEFKGKDLKLVSRDDNNSLVAI
jgi:aminomethyltransferase